MRFAFTDDQRLLATAVGELLEKQCAPEHVRAAEASGEARAPGIWGALAGQGVIGLTAPEAFGGLGLNEVDLVLVLEETGKAALPDPLVETTAVGIPLLRDHAPETLRDAWLQRVACGDALLATGIQGATLDADVSDLLLLRAGDEIHALERSAVAARRLSSIDGTRRLFAVDWSPSPSTLIASGDGVVADALDRGAFGTAAQLLGVADRLIRMSAAHAKERTQFGKQIGSFQAVKHHLATALMHLEFARPVVYRAAYSIATGAPDRSRDASMAKAFASEAATVAAKTALQVHGAIGYTQESDLHVWLKRAWALSAAWGDAARHRERIATTILDQR